MDTRTEQGKEQPTMNHKGYECGCYADTGSYAPDKETPAIDYCPLHQAAPHLLEVIKEAFRVSIDHADGEINPKWLKALTEEAIATAEGRA